MWQSQLPLFPYMKNPIFQISADSSALCLQQLLQSLPEVVSALLILLSGVYTGFYRVDDNVKELGKILLIVFALYAPVKVENMILGGGIIRSGGNTKIIMIIDIVGTWCIGLPLCLLAAYVFKWGIVGVYTLLTTEELFRLAVSLIIFRRRKWIISLC